jgi:endonuclease/exonuclease/phosphatase family metal-dependent hydrolase
MRIRFPLFLFGLAFAGGFFFHGADSRAESPPLQTELSIVSWNIEWYPGKRRSADALEVAAHADLAKEALRAIDPDVLLVQEMRDWQSCADLCDAVPGLRPIVVSAFRAEDTGEYWPQQVAIASKAPAMAGWSEFWRAGQIHPRRGFSVAVLPLPDQRLLLIYNVHLKSNRSADEEEALRNFATRDESIRQLLEHISEMENVFLPGRIAGVVVGGDFNTNQDGQFGDRVHEMMIEAGFVNAWQDTPREKRLTWRGHDIFEPTTLDHFYVRGLPTPRAELVEVAEEASDHWPVRIRLLLPAAATP